MYIPSSGEDWMAVYSPVCQDGVEAGQAALFEAVCAAAAACSGPGRAWACRPG